GIVAGLTIAQAQAAAEQLTAQHQVVFESLNKLQDHLHRTLPENAVLDGVTRERWAEVRYGVATLWALYQSYGARVLRFQTIWARVPQPTQADLAEIEELVTGTTTVDLPNRDGSPQPLHRKLTLDELMAEFRPAYAEICA